MLPPRADPNAPSCPAVVPAMADLTFLLSKLVWGLIRPETLLLALLAAGGVALWRGRLRAARALVGLTLAAVLFVGVLPLGQLLLAPLERAYPTQPELAEVDGILVLGGGESTDLAARWGQVEVNEAADRFLAGIALARRFPEAWVVFTGGRADLVGEGPAGASVAEMIFRQAGIDDGRLLLEADARNTAENAQLTLERIGGAPAGRWVLVTSAFHMPRAMATFCAAGWSNLTPWPTDHRSGTFAGDIGWDLSGHLDSLNLGLKEWAGLIVYRSLGYTEVLHGADC